MKDRLAWSKMRMDPTDFADVTGATYTYLINGLPPDSNWTGLFHPGERVRLRFIDAGAMTYFDVRIPGLKMTVVQADGQNVQPVDVEEFRIAPGETLDVIVEPEDRAYTLFAESLDRSGYARGTLAPRAGMSAPCLRAARARCGQWPTWACSHGRDDRHARYAEACRRAGRGPSHARHAGHGDGAQSPR